MPAYFKPLRRKFGVVTLVMACVLMGGWVRSSTICDRVILIPVTGTHALNLESHRGRFVLSHFQSPRTESATVVWHASQPSTGVYSNRHRWYWRFEAYGFECASWHEDLDEGTFILFPYSSIVIPLTLLSAWLLLSKSRLKPTTPEIDCA